MRFWRRATETTAAATRSLVALQAGPGPRLWIALRASLSIAVPLGALTLLGFEGIGLQTAAGAFTALFFAAANARERAKVLPVVAVALLLSAAAGAALSPWPAAFGIGLVAIAVLASALAFAFRVGPPGPVFFVLAYGLAGNITAVVDGARLGSPAVLLTAMAGGALFSYLLALAPLLRRRAREMKARSFCELLPGPWLGRGERELILRIAVVAAVGTLLSTLLLEPHRAYWTVSAGVAVVGLSASRSYSLGRGLHRSVGTLLGAALALVITPLGADPLLLVLLLAALQFIIELVVVRNYALALVFITPLVLLITGAAAGGAAISATVGERVLDTVIGSAIAMATGLLHRRTPTGGAAGASDRTAP